MAGNRYILGVDGGNSKTDFALFQADGTLRAFLRTGTCSHEALGSYRQAQDAMENALSLLYQQSGVLPGEIHSAVFGLAGVDIPSQQAGMEAVIRSLGFRQALVCNDGFLGIKAASVSGRGICCINGTGTVTVGVDDTGRCLQVGGIGSIAGDLAGGAYLARQAITAAYAQRFRNGPAFGATGWIEEALQIVDQSQWLEAIHPTRLDYKPFMTELIQLLIRLAREQDPAACAIITGAAQAMADGVIGCIRNLTFHRQTEIILAGSVWAKGNSQLMMDVFTHRIARSIPQTPLFILLDAPPVLGAVYWAMERFLGSWPEDSLRERIRRQISPES